MRRPLTLALVLTLSQSPLAAQLKDVTDQFRDYGRIKGRAGAHLEYAQPEGELGDFVDQGFGLSGWVGVGLDHDSRVLIGLEAGYVNYGTRTRSIAVTPSLPWAYVDVTTTNNIVTAGIPLRIELTNSRLRPYAMGSVGGAYFFTQSSVNSGSDDDVDTQTMYSDLTFNWTAGAGLVYQIQRGETPVYLDFGFRHVDNGEVKYLTDRSIQEYGSTTVITPVRSQANFSMFQFGVAVGLR